MAKEMHVFGRYVRKEIDNRRHKNLSQVEPGKTPPILNAVDSSSSSILRRRRETKNADKPNRVG